MTKRKKRRAGSGSVSTLAGSKTGGSGVGDAARCAQAALATLSSDQRQSWRPIARTARTTMRARAIPSMSRFQLPLWIPA
jgi:hypothetical protein